jgi:4-hydroxyacetophenone monooxygenase
MGFDFAALVADEPQFRNALKESDIATLAMVLVQLTADETILTEIAPFIRGPWDYSVSLPDDIADRIRARLAETLKTHAAENRDLPPPPSNAQLQKMMSVCVGEPVSDEYAPMMLEELAFHEADPKGVNWRHEPAAETIENFHVAVIGAGMSGILAAIKLKQAGIPFTVIEKNDTVGGTWYENRYPGCAVDTPNHFYSYSFEPSHEWTHFYSKGDELHFYLEGCADKYDIRRHIRFDTEVESARFDEAAKLWRLTARGADGATSTLTANAIISAVGQLNRPAIPDIPGLADFQGPVFHTAQWEAEHDLEGKRVAMIGTGASAMQTGPSIAGDVERLLVFQRTPHWVIANPNYHRSVSPGKKWVLEHLPFYARWYRFQLFWGFSDGIHPALQVDPDWHMPERSLNERNERFRVNMIRHMKNEIGDDAELLAKVKPSYPPYGKRMLVDNHWYKMLTRDNVDLVTDPIERAEAGAIVTRDGQNHPVDLIVLATGFQVSRMLWPMEITGRGGIGLRDLWGEDDPKAYLGITVPKFPNFFVLYGPNTNLGHGGSAMFHGECQVRYVMKCLRDLIEGGHATMECRQDVHDAFNERCDRAHEKMVWAHKGTDNWYKNSRGRVFANSPWRLVDYWSMTAAPNPDDYITA